MVLTLRTLSRRRLPLGRRDSEGLNAWHRTKLAQTLKNVELYTRAHEGLKKIPSAKPLVQQVKIAIFEEVLDALRCLVIDVPDEKPRQRADPMDFAKMQAELERLQIECSQRFRFQSFDHLRRLIVGFQFPTGKIKISGKRGHVSTAEEILLISLTRLSFPSRWSDMAERFPGRSRTFMQAAFYWFLEFMVQNWGYLLLNNMAWWKPYLASSSEAIRSKLANLNHVNWRRNYPPADQPGGFRYAMFIDNTMVPFCRPGGVMEDGPAAPRVPLEVQEAWWTGWKKLHGGKLLVVLISFSSSPFVPLPNCSPLHPTGLKYQTAILANGMDFHVYGPNSVRRNDLYMLKYSELLPLFEELQEHDPFFFKIFGDSAYFDAAVLGTGGGRGMASVRESVEWTYKDLKALWKYCDWNHALQLRKQPIFKIVFVCMLLRNVYVSMHGSQACEYFVDLPPSFEQWVEQGPHAHPLPSTSIFSSNYHPPGDEDSDSDEEDDENDN